MKNNLEWYRHKVESHNHKKFKMLRIVYAKTFDTDGWAGEGKFWALNNMIADSDHCELDCTSPMNKLSTAAELGFTVEEFDRYIKILVECNLVQEEKGFLFTDDVQDCLAATQEKREAAAIRQKNRRAKVDQNRKSRKQTDTSHVTNQMSHEFVDESQGTNQQSSSNSNSNSNSKRPVTENEFSGNEGQGINKDGKNNQQQEQPDAPPPPPSKPPRKPSVRKTPEESTPHWKKLVEIFGTMHQMCDHKKMAWRPMDYAHLKKIADALQKIAEEEGKEWTLQVCATRFNEFLSKASMIEWLKGKFTPPKLYSQLNEILAYKPSYQRETVKRNGVFTTCLENYRHFYVKAKKIEPSIRKKDEEALDMIIQHLEKITTGDNPDISESFGVILDRWHVLPKYLQDRMDISDMYYNLNKIIDNIKNPQNNGHVSGTNGFHQRRQTEYTSDFATAYNNLDPRLG